MSKWTKTPSKKTSRLGDPEKVGVRGQFFKLFFAPAEKCAFAFAFEFEFACAFAFEFAFAFAPS
jgi:hypothetical protein